MATKDSGGQRQTTRRTEEKSRKAAPQGTEEVKERQDKLTDDVDAILDEIDEVLEENAEESSAPTSRRAASDGGPAQQVGFRPRLTASVQPAVPLAARPQ